MSFKSQDVLNQEIQEPPDRAKLSTLARQQARKVQLLLGYYIVMLAALVFALVTLHWQLGLVTLLGAYLGILFKPEYRPHHFDPIPGSACQAALDGFSATPEGRRYLGKLREMGRQVTWFDLEAVKTWNDILARTARRTQIRSHDQIDDRARSRLYGLEA